MRLAPVLVWFALLLVGCRSQGASEPPREPLAGSAQRLRLVYEVDLEQAIDDRHGVLRGDLEAALDSKLIEAAVRVEPAGVVVEVGEPANKPKVEALVAELYRDQIELRACADVCFRLSKSAGAAVKAAALDVAVTIIRERLAALKVKAPSVTARGQQIVIEVDPGEERVRTVIARRATLELQVVDHDSELMRDAYALAAKDPRAKELGLVAEIDQWRVESGGSLAVDYYFVAPARAVLETYFAELAKRDPRYQVPDHRVIAYEQLPPGQDGKTSWRSYYLHRFPELTGADVANAEGATDPGTNRPLVLVDFNRAGARKLADATARNVGRKLAIVLDGQIRSAPIINGTITGGRVAISMGGTDVRVQEAERDELVNVLNTGSLPAPLREVR